MARARGTALLWMVLAGCGGDAAVEWRVQFESAELEARADEVQFRVLTGGCEGEDVHYAATVPVREDGAAPAPPPLPDGRWGIEARARDEACTWFAARCQELETPSDATQVLLVLRASAEETDCAGCDAPGCTDRCGVVTEVSVGARHTCAIDEGGGAWCWGANDRGQLGVGAAGDDALRPMPVAGGGSWTGLAAGDAHTCGVQSDGSVWCWGANDAGQLGQDGGDRAEPTHVGNGFVSVAAGATHTCAILADASMECWGGNSRGQLGNGTSTDSSTPVAPSAGPDRWSVVSSHDDTTCALGEARSLWCWGDNSNGQLGTGDSNELRDRPEEVDGSWQAIAVGARHTCAVDDSAEAACWGDGDGGALGTGSTDSRRTPGPIEAAGPFLALAAGERHTCGLDTAGGLRCWGAGDRGQLGLGPVPAQLAPAPVAGESWSAVAAGGDHTCALAAGQLRCWGANDHGQLASGDQGDRASPSSVCLPASS